MSSVNIELEHNPKDINFKTILSNEVCGIDIETDELRKLELIKEQNIRDIKDQCSELISELDSDEDPEAIVKRHISKIQKYDDLKDIALGLVTMIADQRKLRTMDILEEMKDELNNQSQTI